MFRCLGVQVFRCSGGRGGEHTPLSWFPQTQEREGRGEGGTPHRPGIPGRGGGQLIPEYSQQNDCSRSWMTCMSSAAERVSHVHRVLQEELWVHSRIQVHHGKTQVWKRARVPPTGLDAMTAAARIADPTTIVWRGDPSLPRSQQGMKILGTLDNVLSQLRSVTESHQILFERIQCVSDLQAAWLLLLYCAGTRATYFLRAVHPNATVEYAAEHDGAMRRCLCRLLESDIPDAS